MEVTEKEFYRRMGMKRTESPEDGKEVEIVKEVELSEKPRYNSDDTAGIIEKIGKTLKEACTFSSQNVETDGVYITRMFNGGNAKVEICYPICDDGMLKRSFKIKYPERLAAKFQELLKDLTEWKSKNFDMWRGEK